jgi:hypothetical protein
VRHMSTNPPTGGSPAMTFLSLFAGIGGFDLPLTRLGMRCVGQVELDPAAQRVLARHLPEAARHDDIHTTLAWWHATPRPRVDLVCAGWPCQDLSQAGRRAGLAGPRSGLFSSWPASLTPYIQAGFCSTTSPGCSPATRARTSRRSSLRWLNSGTAFRGGCLMRATFSGLRFRAHCCVDCPRLRQALGCRAGLRSGSYRSPRSSYAPIG